MSIHFGNRKKHKSKTVSTSANTSIVIVRSQYPPIERLSITPGQWHLVLSQLAFSDYTTKSTFYSQKPQERQNAEPAGTVALHQIQSSIECLWLEDAGDDSISEGKIPHASSSRPTQTNTVSEPEMELETIFVRPKGKPKEVDVPVPTARSSETSHQANQTRISFFCITSSWRASHLWHSISICSSIMDLKQIANGRLIFRRLQKIFHGTDKSISARSFRTMAKENQWKLRSRYWTTISRHTLCKRVPIFLVKTQCLS